MKKEYCDNCGIKFNQNKDKLTMPYRFENGKAFCQYCRYKYCGTKSVELTKKK